MTLTRDAMIARCLDGFFLAMNAKDLDRVAASFAPEAQMLIPSGGFVYKDAHDIMVHLADVADNFATIDFHHFHVVADPDEARVAVTFEVCLTDHDGVTVQMRNANFFDLAPDGRIARVVIIATKPLDKGFQVGRS